MRTPSTTASDFDSCRGRSACARRVAFLPFLGSLAVFLVILAGARPAQAEITHKLDSSFSPGVFPAAVAVDKQSGSVYVRDFISGKIVKYGPTGAPQNFSALGKNEIAVPCGEKCNQIAVDNSGGPNQGVIYVSSNVSSLTTGNRQVFVYLPNGEQADSIKNWSVTQRDRSHPYCGVATDAFGGVYVGHVQGMERSDVTPKANGASYVDRFAPGKWVSLANEEHKVWPVVQTMWGLTPEPNGGTCLVSANSLGDLYYSFFTEYFSKHTVSLAQHGAFNGLPGPAVTTVDAGSTDWAVDNTTNDVYFDHESEVVRKSKSGEVRESFGSGDLIASYGVAVNATSGTVYVADLFGGDVKIYKAVVTPDITGVTAAARPTTAAVMAHLDLAGAGEITECKVEYGTSSGYGSSAACTPSTPYTLAKDVSVQLAGLTKETTYHYRVVAKNTNGTNRSSDRTFKTHNVGAVTADAPTDVTQTSATLHGTFDGGTADAPPTISAGNSFYYFEWGQTTEYGSTTSAAPGVDAGAAAELVHVSAPITGLSTYLPTSDPYHFRLVVTNSFGTTKGPDRTFFSAPPDVPGISQSAASGVTTAEATLGASINPGGGATVYFFEYGSDSSYGSSTLSGDPLGGDHEDHSVSAPLSGLQPGATYHFRVVASNFGGTSHGPDQVFTTEAAPSPPIESAPLTPAVPQAPPPAEGQQRKTQAKKCRKGFVKRHGKCRKKNTKHRRNHRNHGNG
jgi:hypothetical protein